MSETHPISIRLSPEKTALLDQIAAQQDRSRSYLVKQAVDDFLTRYQAWIDGVQKSIDDADAGLGVPMEQAFAEIYAELGITPE